MSQHFCNVPQIKFDTSDEGNANVLYIYLIYNSIWWEYCAIFCHFMTDYDLYWTLWKRFASKDKTSDFSNACFKMTDKQDIDSRCLSVCHSFSSSHICNLCADFQHSPLCKYRLYFFGSMYRFKVAAWSSG